MRIQHGHDFNERLQKVKHSNSFTLFVQKIPEDDASLSVSLSFRFKIQFGKVSAGRLADEASVAAVKMGIEEDQTCPRLRYR